MRYLKSPRILVALLIVGVLLAMALWPGSRLVDTAFSDTGLVRETVDAEGRTRLVDRYVVAAPVAALARRLDLEPGDQIEQGQVLVRLQPSAAAPLDPRERASAEAAISAAGARLAGAGQQQSAAAAVFDQAVADAERLRTMVSRGLVAIEAAEQAETQRILAERAMASARFIRATAQHELELAQAALRHGEGKGEPGTGLELTAPVTGVLLRRHFESARPVQAGEALVEVGDPARLEVEVDVLSADAVRLDPGMDVELLRWGRPEPLQGRVRRIEPGGFTKFSALGVEEQRVWVIVDLVSPAAEWHRLGDAYRVNARFILQQAESALRLPTSAVFRHGEGHATFVIEGGRARLRPIQIGLQGGGHSQVLGGIEVETPVIVHPDRIIQDGDRVRPR